MSIRMIVIEADNLQEARRKLRDRIPAELYLLSETTISDGMPIIKDKQTIVVEAESLEKARERIKTHKAVSLAMQSS